MAVFPSFKLTEKGEELLNRSIGEGKTLTFTKFELGDGNTPSDFRKQTGLVNKFYEFPILNTSIQKDQVLRIRGYFDNKSFSQDKQLKEIGVFVKIEGNETQYLYSYTNAGDTGDIIPANSRGFYSRTLDVANYIGYATNITFNIEQLRDRYAFNTENEMKVASYLKAGDKVELWGNLVLGDKPTDEYIIQDSGEIELSNGLFAKKVSFKYIAQTIEEMQKLALKVGDIVEVLGYYQAGDGAGHQRVISNTDDGSGVQLNNGLWANIIKTTQTTVDHFGAKGDGVTGDSDAIIKMHYWDKSAVRFSAKTYLIEKPLPIQWYCNYIGDDKGIINGTTIFKASDDLTSFFDTVRTNVYKAYNFKIKGIRFNGNKICDWLVADIEIGSYDIINCNFYDINTVFNQRPVKFNSKTRDVAFGVYLNIQDCDFEVNTVFDWELTTNEKKGWANQNYITRCHFKCNRVLNINKNKLITRQDWKWDNCSFERFVDYQDRVKSIIWSEYEGCKNELFLNCYIEGISAIEKCTEEEYNEAKSNGTVFLQDFNDISDYPVTKKSVYKYNGYYYASDNSKMKEGKQATFCYFLGGGNVAFENCIIAGFDSICRNDDVSSNYYMKTNVCLINCTCYRNVGFASKSTSIYFDLHPNSNIEFNNTWIRPISKLTSKPCNITNDISAHNTLDVESIGVNNELIPKNNIYITFNKDERNGFGNIKEYPLLVDEDFLFKLIKKGYNYFYLVNSTFEIKKLYLITDVNITLDLSNNSRLEFITQSYGVPYFNLYNCNFTINGGVVAIKNYTTGSINACIYTCKASVSFTDLKFETGGSTGAVKLIRETKHSPTLIRLSNLTGELPTGSTVCAKQPFNSEVINVNVTGLTNNLIPTELNSPAMLYAMELEGGAVKEDYLNYSLERMRYNKQLEAEEKAKQEAYELLLQDNPNLTWEEFEQTYGNTSMMNLSLVERLEEPQIPESVVKFMEKYL